MKTNMYLCTFAFILFATPYVIAQSSSTTETPQCAEGEFRCNDGVCIAGVGQCNGSVECADRSDETFPLCRNNTCPENTFRCTYGACVKSSATCDDKKDCADNSDELLPICRNDVDRNICRERIIEERQLSKSVFCENSRDTCDNGQVLKQGKRCDGRVDCDDKTDEVLATCADAVCEAPLFQCAYGGCAHRKAQCNGVQECADGSDESNELCNRMLQATPPTQPSIPQPPATCIVPPPPEHGSQSLGGNASAVPGHQQETFALFISCDPGYRILGSSTVFCVQGTWSGEYPRCVRFCHLPKQPSVEYRCALSDSATEGTRECEEMEPDGNRVQPRCRQPVFYYPGIIFDMTCVDGKWDNVIVCTPDCGKLGTPAEALLAGAGRQAERDELPWHVGIYRRKKHRQICGGTIVSHNLVITAAHCFWDDATKLQPASNYMVAAGKLYRTWNHPNDTNAQTSDVQEIKLPARFQGAATSFQDDIALVLLMSSFQYTEHVRPVCLDFDTEFDLRQLKYGSKGLVAGWGRTSETSGYSKVLRVAEMPFVTIQECIADTPPGFKSYITSDKICAGYKNGTALCEGDSGGGLAFPERERGTLRFYLRGVASTAVNNQRLCSASSITTFTHLVTHEQFVQDNL